MPSKYVLTHLEKDRYYHIYNRGNNGEKLFYIPENYLLFMNLYEHYLGPYVETFAFCLMPNHFHFLIRVKCDNEVDRFESISNQFRKMFIKYALFINRQENRTGSLFSKCFKRIEVDNLEYLKRLVAYIHLNPLKHGIDYDFQNYKFSSYKLIRKEINHLISIHKVYSWFNGKKELFEYHRDFHEEKSLFVQIIEHGPD